MPEKTVNEQLAEQVGGGDSKIIAAIFGVLTDQDEAKLLLAAAPPATAEAAEARSARLDRLLRRLMINYIFSFILSFCGERKKPNPPGHHRGGGGRKVQHERRTAQILSSVGSRSRFH